MSLASGTAPQNQIVFVLRTSTHAGHDEADCLFSAPLRSHGITLFEKPTPSAVVRAVEGGSLTGLVVLMHEDDLDRLDEFAAVLDIGRVAWVGLIARHLIGLPRVREFIAEHLFNFITMPAQTEHIVLALRHARGMASVRDALNTAMPLAADAGAPSIIGKSAAMRRLSEQIAKVARTDASVLINGASGTGKELVARSLHQQSARKNAPFCAVNCGAIAPQLFQSELFGYERGAFTGASQRKIGRIEAAQGGTLFLDEIGDMPLDMQVNLLRFLQEKTIERVGGNKPLAIDVRIVAATHIDLAERVRQGRFREDLYYRINVICIATPRLAERVEDIEDLASCYFHRFARRHRKGLRGFSSAAMDALLRHDWPGNVRELVNRVQRAVVMAEGRFIQPEDLDFAREATPVVSMSLEHARARAEGALILQALAQTRNRISHAADLLGISRVTLYRLLEKHNISIGASLGKAGHDEFAAGD
jgi:DNA-binding NtrC family response regulator